MKRNIIQFFIGSIAFFFFALSFAADTYTLDTHHTFVVYRINHLGFSTQTGKWPAQGHIVLDQAKPQLSKVTVTVPLAEVITGIKELDQHLKGKNFFDVAQYPVATFVSDKVNVTGKNTAKVHGLLTLHGVSKPITLDVSFNKSGINPITNQMTVGFTAKTKIKRSDFGITTLVPSLGDEVTLDIEAEGAK